MTRRETLCGWLVAAALLLAGPAARTAPPDPDADGDGLSDFQEVHKYRTDPTKAATADGIPDGDWQQRREFTYSVRAVIRVMPPYDLATLNDDYQDVRVLRQTPEYAELEVVVYPLNTNAAAIRGNPNWKADYAGMTEYLAPGVTTNWDDEMRQTLLRELAADGIHPDRLTDKEVVEQVSRWLFRGSKHTNMFCTYYVHFPDGKPAVLPGLEGQFETDKGDRAWSVREQFEHELLGREMFARKSYGTCTSAAVYQCTVLRALGIPARMILCIPPADGSDDEQVALVRKLTNHRVRAVVEQGVLAGGHAFTAHTFCEAFVGGRWRRLNYTTLGQDVLSRGYLGLMVRVHTFKDLSDANLAATWGKRYALHERAGEFRHANPYRLVEISDHFGKHATVPNPPAEKEHTRITLTKVYWYGDPQTPAFVTQGGGINPADGAGHLLVHGDEWFEDAGDYLQYKVFLRRADPNFVLKAAGRPDVKAHLTLGFFTQASAGVREMELVIPREESARMAAGVAYTLHPVNAAAGYQWAVQDGVMVTKP